MGTKEMSGSGVLIAMIRYRKLIVKNFLFVTLFGLILSLLLPKWYKATVTLLPPKQPDLFGAAGAVSSVLKSLPGAVKLGGVSQKGSGYNYFAILKSRTTMERVVKKFDLINVYGIPDDSMEGAIKELTGNVTFEETNDELIVIEVLDKDPLRSAEMANYFVESLNEISIMIGTREARNNREFVERRLEDTRKDLRKSEDLLQKYQERSGFIITPEQTDAIAGIGTLYARKVLKEVELSIVQKQVADDSPAITQLKNEIDAISTKLASIPESGMTSLRLYRDVIIQQKIVEFLVPLYEQARIEEQKNVPVILTLDKAVVPEKKYKPKRSMIVVSAALLSIVASILFVFTKVTWNRFSSSADSNSLQLKEVLMEARKDPFGFKTK